MTNVRPDNMILRGAELTPGFLPVAAFGHLGPTAVGTIDLDTPRQVSLTTGLRRDHRDALLLVRLHHEPLGVLHVPDASITANADQLVALIDRQLGPRVRRHEERFRCRVSDVRCPGDAAPQVPGAVAVIIATTGRIDTLDRCLSSLTPLQRDDLEIIVVDNRPDAHTRELVSSWSARDRRLRYVAEGRRGLPIARNRGIAETRAEFVAFTDDDVVADQNWLPWLLAPFVDAKVTAVTGMVLPLELETVAQKLFEQYAGFCKGFDRHSYDLRSNRADERLLYPYWGGMFGSGNSMAFRRADLVVAGGFDPALGVGATPHGEDIDAMSSAILRGGQLVYEPRSLCWHEHRRDDDALRRQVFNYGVGFTAMLTKALTHDPGFASAVVRSVPVALRIRRHRARRSGATAALPPEFARIERRGMLRGPIVYARSVRTVRRMRLNEVINGG
jgi:GT2 family glycosyltransferase